MAAGDKGPALFWVSCILPTVAYIAFLARFGWRWYHKQRGMDDVALAFGTCMLVAQTALGFVALHYGFGKHSTELSPTNMHKALFCFYLMQITYKFLGGGVKLAFCFLYLRVFQIRTFQFFTKLMIANVVFGTLAFGLATIVQCVPVHRAWDKTIDGTCINLMAFWYSHSVWHAATDVVIFIMPMPVVRGLHLPGANKWGLASVFGLGAFVCAASIVRMTTLAGSSKSNDPTLGSFDAVLWTEIESSIAVLCASLPALRSPILRLFRHITGKQSIGQDSRSRSHVYPMETNSRSITREAASGQAGGIHVGPKSWYDAVLRATDAGDHEGRKSSSSSQERIVGIIRTTDVQISAHHQPTQREKDFRVSATLVDDSDVERGSRSSVD